VSTILNIFPKSKLTKLANLVQLKRMLMFCLEDWGRGLLPPPPFGYATGIMEFS